MRTANQYAIDRIRQLAPPNGDQRMNLETRLGPTAQEMLPTPAAPTAHELPYYIDDMGNVYPKGDTLTGAFNEFAGLEQDLDRNMVIPWNQEAGWHVPELLRGALQSAYAPGHVAGGGPMTMDEVLQAGLDTGGTMFGGATIFGPRNALAMGGGKVGPLWDDLSKTRLTMPVDEMTRTTVPAHDMTPQVTVSPESLQGSVLQPLLGDRSAAGEYLTAINDTPLANPVLLEGGPDFMRGLAAQADNAIWASNPGVPTRLQNNINSAAREFDTDNINLVYTANGARNADFATMTTDAILEQLPSSPILRKTVKQFDLDMKKLVPNWPGLESNNLRDFLFRPGMGDQRKAFVELIAKRKYQELGLPDIGSTRFAITNPGLLGEPTGVSGYAIGRGIPDADVLSSPSVPHTTYAHQMQGDYLGGLDVGIPRDVMFPDFYAQRRNLGADPARDDRAFMLRNVSQVADQEWLDGVMQYINSINN
jgi:hypothetical protein